MTEAAAAPTLRGISLTAEQEWRAAALHRGAIVFDGSSVVKQEPAHIERARAGGVTATNHTVTRPNSDLPKALWEVNYCRRWIDANPDDVLLATSTEQIRLAKESGREAIVFGPQNTEFIGTDLSLVGTFYDLGVRILQLTYQRQNWVGSGCGERRDAGLTRFGRELVREMDQLGIVVDLSHCGPVTSLDAIEASRNPVVFSHAHPAALSPHARAKEDDLLKALAAKGGVIGVTALSAYLYDPKDPAQRPTLENFVRHVHYLVDLIGIDHVGIGLDFDETNTPEKHAAAHRANPEFQSVFGWDDRRAHDLTNAAEEGNITRALVAAELSDADIDKILGGNFLRVFDQVLKA